MQPAELSDLTIAGRPALASDGTCWISLIHPDLEADDYRGSIHRFAPDGQQRRFTNGDRDTDPVLSPDAKTLVFLRATGGAPAQLWSVPTTGGEARQLTWHPLGAGSASFSPDGSTLLYTARVPEAGRYGLDPDVSSADEAPRRISTLRYRADNVGFILDRPAQAFCLSLAEAGTEPAKDSRSSGSGVLQLTEEPGGVSDPTFTTDSQVLYVREAAPDSLFSQLVQVAGSRLTAPAEATVIAAPQGTVAHPVVDGEIVYYYGVVGPDNDLLGLSPGLFRIELNGSAATRLTDPETVWAATDIGRPIPRGDQILISVADRGSVALVAVPAAEKLVTLTELRRVISGESELRSMVATSDRLAAVVATASSPGELMLLPITADGSPAAPPRTLTENAEPLRRNGIAPQIELSGTAPDGYPVHGWLVLPAGDGPHPVLLDVHGGPHAAYGWGYFDEAQVYAAAGYAVVLPNPRGSIGYGQQHARAILQHLGERDADDVLALLDVALARVDLDSARVGVMGGSYGGFMTSWLASHAPGRFVAGISERAVNAWDSFAGSSDIGWRFAQMLVGGSREQQWRQSPLAYADDIDIPLLIVHSEHDWRCPVEQAQRLFVSLKQRDAEVEMVLFPSEGHELSRSGRPRHRQQRFDAILEWWARHLPVSTS